MESGNEYVDKWVCPNDRNLALRGRLDTGWSTFPDNVYKRSYVAAISDEEQERIIKVLREASELEEKEQERIGYLVDKVSNLKASIIGDGQVSCLVCGTKKGPLKPCNVCSRGVCPKCTKETTDANSPRQIFCVICWEERELWKKSGAWFLKSMPNFITPEERNARKASDGYDSYGNGQRSTLDPRGSLTPSIRRPSFYTEEDESDESSESESEDDISSHHDVMSSAYRTSPVGFNLGIDVSETSKEIPRSVTPPEIALPPESPDFAKPKTKSFTNGIDQVDGSESPNSLSPSMRPRTSSGLSEGKKKLALKFRKKNKPDGRSGSPKLELTSQKSKSEEDIDEIFKSYEQQNRERERQQKGNDFGPLGMLEFTLQYDSHTLELLVIVHCGKGLKAMDHGKSSDPYVKTHLLPGASKSTKKRTQTVMKDLNPIFNETLIYHGVSENEVAHKTLRLSVMDENKLSSNAFIGETCVTLKTLNSRPVQRFKRLLSGQSDEHSYEELVEMDDSPGRIELALHYLSKQRKLVVGIIRCAGLKAMDPNGYSDPYVKCYMLPDPKKKSKRKTVIKKKTLNPEFNEEFIYEIAHNDLAKRSLCITVWDHDVGTRNDFIGSVSLGIKASGEALKHWFETLKTSDRKVTRWHTLSSYLPTEMEDEE